MPHEALIDIVSVINRPQRDEMFVREAGIPLDRALFPLLVVIERRGPIGVVELADRVGRDYTTVSRQVAKLESLGLVERRLRDEPRAGDLGPWQEAAHLPDQGNPSPGPRRRLGRAARGGARER